MDTIETALASLPPVLQPAVNRWLERLGRGSGGPGIGAGDAAALLKVVAASEFAGNVLLRDRQWLSEGPGRFRSPPASDDMRAFAAGIARSEAAGDEIKAAVRRFRNRQLLHILWREVTGQAAPGETLNSLSELADALIDGTTRYAARQLQARSGRLLDADGAEVPLVILGMGKLGGGELNFSSDVDLVFLYPRDGESEGPRRLAAQPYFTRLSQAVVALLDEVTEDGFAFRVDTRLRPFGESGPAVTSFAALESYLLQHGRDWERYAYVKARIVGPQPPAQVTSELFDDLINPFVYRRYLDYGVFESLRDMHTMIAAEVRRRELADDLKLGPGGIREIEFIVQSLQLVRGGSQPELRSQALEAVLPRLADSRALGAAAVAGLGSAYAFLRRLENFVQAIRDRQTHELPIDAADRARLCLAMDYPDWTSLLADLVKHRDVVTREFEAIAFRDGGEAHEDDAEARYADLWAAAAPAADWQAALQGHPRAAELAERMAAFCSSASTEKIDTASRRRLQRFVPRLVPLVLACDGPVPALERSIEVLRRILRRSAYVALLNENPLAAERLVSLCEKSAWIADQLARFPVLLDELLDPRIYTERVDRAELARELAGHDQARHAADSEALLESLAQFQRANMFRVAVADFGGILPIMRVSDSLTYLAETTIERALEIAWDDVVAKHGVPHYEIDGERRAAGFGVIAYGKLGGLELSYGSDLDLVFLHDSHGSRQSTDGDRPLENSMFFARLVRRLVHILTTQTSSGVMYEIDMRLRPDGRSGLLVTSTEAFERYQEANAWTWEHQALLRARPVAGSSDVARSFERIRHDTLVARVRRDTLRDDVSSMRARMRKELDRSDADRFDVKNGRGGIGDIEFIVQFLVLDNAARYPSVIRYSDNIRQIAALASVGCVDIRSAARLQEIYRLFRLRLHHLSLNDREPFVAAGEFGSERDFVTSAWNLYLGTGAA